MAEELDLIPLARAAALAHNRVFPGESVRDMKTLDLLALALSTLIKIYQREGEKDAPRAVAAADIAAGRFTRGATRLEIAGRAPLRFLMVSRRDLPEALEALARDDAALHRLSPRAASRSTDRA